MSLKEMVKLHGVKEPSSGTQNVNVELRSLEIAVDALEIIVRALHMNTDQESHMDDSIEGSSGKILCHIDKNGVPASATIEMHKNDALEAKRELEMLPLVLEHPPIVLKEIVKGDPPITLFRRFLNEFEVNYLIRKAEGMWIPSLTGKVDDIDGLNDSENPMEQLRVLKSENRTSCSCVMDVDDPVVKLIVDRVALISGYSQEHIERLSLVRSWVHVPQPARPELPAHKPSIPTHSTRAMH
jgi:hypothetical protein